jgi:hypothetical protein
MSDILEAAVTYIASTTRWRGDANSVYLGYKMAKWINRIEFVDTFEHIGKGQGGWRDDVLHYYPSDAGI